jgi:hypothetical protein
MPHCGYYKGQQVIEKKNLKEKRLEREKSGPKPKRALS